MKRKKVLYLPLVYYPENSGYANAFQAFVKAVGEHTDVVMDILTLTPLNGQPEVVLKNGSIHRFEKRKAPGFLPLRLLYNLGDRLRFQSLLKKRIDEGRYDLVFIETFEDFFLLSLLPKQYFDKIAIRIHATQETEQYFYFPGLVNRIARTALRRVITQKARYIVSTNHYHNNFIKEVVLRNNTYFISQKSFFVLPNTIRDLPVAASVADPQQSAAGANRRLSFVTLGRMDKTGILQKGFDDILDAFTLIKKDVSGIDVLFIGGGREKPALQQRVAQSGFSFISFAEGLTNQQTLQILQQSDVVILASRYEGMSMFALEALATGNALLFSHTGGLSDMVEDNGLTFATQNIEELAEKILELQNMAAEKRAAMKQASVKLYEQKFSNEKVAARFESLLQIISTRNGSETVFDKTDAMAPSVDVRPINEPERSPF
jgi:glycosyltransferase involved in cell wall biosynthesis